MACLAISETREYNVAESYSETTTLYLANRVIEQLPMLKTRIPRNTGMKFEQLKSNFSGIFKPTSSYPYLEDANDSLGYFLGTIERLVIASQRRVYYMNGENEYQNLKPISLDLPELERRFVNLKEQWYNDTVFCSSISLMQDHPAYQEILSMGADVIPFIFRELEKGLGYWFPALKSITSHDPVDSKDRGRVKIMTQSWLQWGKEQGYKW